MAPVREAMVEAVMCLYEERKMENIRTYRHLKIKTKCMCDFHSIFPSSEWDLSRATISPADKKGYVYVD